MGAEAFEERTLLSATLEYALIGPGSGAQAGTAVDTSTDYIVVGSPYSGASSAGQVFVYSVADGSLVYTFNNPTPAVGDLYGAAVAINGDLIVVGSPGNNAPADDVGTAYVYRASTGALVATLNNPEANAADQFGDTVAISGSTIVVGAKHDDFGKQNAGSVYVFDSSGTFLRSIRNPEADANDHFGSHVAIDGTTLVVGCDLDNFGQEDAGSVYVFNASTGALLQTIHNPSPTTNDNFGHEVDISGNRVVVPVELDEVGVHNDAGSFYVFDLTSATPATPVLYVTNPSPGPNDHFGSSIEIEGDMIVVGAENGGVGDSGLTYVYDLGSPAPGIAACSLTNPDVGAGDRYGSNVAIAGSVIVVGAPLHDNTTTLDVGAAYVYRLSPDEPLLKVTPKVRHLLETTIMNGTLKVADLVLSGDVSANYTLGMIGTDSSIFEIIGTELYIKQGVVFDYETQPRYAIDVTLDDNAIPGSPDATATFILQMINVPELPEIQVSVSGVLVPDAGTVNFGEAAVGATSPTRTFEVRNTGIVDLILQPMTLPAGFTLTTPNFTAGQIVVPGAAATFTVAMSTATAGTKGGEVIIPNNDPDAEQAIFNINLAGGVIETASGVTIIDDGDIGFYATANWATVSGYGYQADARTGKSTDGTRRAIWAFGELTPGGQYRVSATWLNGSDRSTNIPVIIRDGVGGPILAEIRLNEALRPTGTTIGGRPFQVLDTVTLSGSVLVIELSNAGTDKLVVADAMRIEDVTPPVETPDITVRESGVAIGDGCTHIIPTVNQGDTLQKAFTVRNDGTANIILQPVVVSGTGYSLVGPNFTADQVLAPGAEVTFTLAIDTSSIGTFLGNITIPSNDPDESPFDIIVSATVRDPSITVFVVDDGDPEFTLVGVWTGVTHTGYGLDAVAVGKNLPGAKATWTFSGLIPGEFQLATTWLFGSDRATNATYVVRDGAGGPILASVVVNQKLAPSGGGSYGGRPFSSLGSVSLSGNTLVVELANAGADGVIVADAFRIERVTPPANSPEITVTAGAVGIVDGGTFSLGTGTLGGAGLSQTFTVKNTGTADLVLQPIVLSGTGYSLISANFTAGQVIAPGAEVTFTVGLSAASLGKFTGNISFVNSDADESPFNLTVSGTITEPVPAGVTIIDDGDPGFSTTGPWNTINNYGFGSDALSARTGTTGVKTAQWVFDVASAGTYEVAATWLRGSDRATNASYVIRDGVGGAVLATITVNQTLNPLGNVYGGRPFQVLQNVTLTGTQLVVELSTDGTSGVVVADAVRIASM